MYGVTSATIRNRVCRWRKQNGMTHIVPLASLQAYTSPLMMRVIDDRLDDNAVNILNRSVVSLIELSGLPRATFYRRLDAFRRVYSADPLPLRAFLKFALTYHPRRGRPYRNSLLPRTRPEHGDR